MRFEGRSAIVTGAAGGIGKATALRFAKEGAKVAVVDLMQEGVDAVADEIRAAGGTALALAVDISKNEDVKAATEKVLAEFGQIDILVNCAGIGWRKQIAQFKDESADDWRPIMDVNVMGTMYFTHSVLDHMVGRKYGRIINVSSIASKGGLPRLAAYAASKGAVDAFTKSIAMELAEYNITVNGVSPGMVSHDEEFRESNGTFLGRYGKPSENAAVITFLASDEAAFITGSDYLVDGGRTLGPRGV